ncbi:MAG: glycosyl hydrolase [Verrucomicrobiota bacterium]
MRIIIFALMLMSVIASGWAQAGTAYSRESGWRNPPKAVSAGADDDHRADEDLAKRFSSPPDSAKATGYWWWFNGRMDKAGITRDLEEFKAKGLGGIMMVWSSSGRYGGDPVPEGPVKFLSPEWCELYRFALIEAHRLGLEVGVNLCGGWCMGGPWITPEYAGRWFLQSELTVKGPQKFSDRLPLPGPKDGYDSPPQLNVAKTINLPFDQVDYRDTSVVAFREPATGSRLEGSRKQNLPPKSNRLDADTFIPARRAMDQTLTPWENLPGDQPIDPAGVIDLTAKLQADGRLVWDVPEGTWTIIRTGHRITGARVSLSMPESDGLEVDWFSSAAVDQQWNHLGKILLQEAGVHVGKTLRYFATDSFEDGYPNWTPGIIEAFKKYRGYDPMPYLPVFRGRLVGSAEISDRFLYDYRKTIADCMADNNYGHLAKLARAQGMEIACEAAGPSWSGTICMDALKNLGRCDRPQGEFWRSAHFVVSNQNQVSKQTASAAHIYGRRLASAEAFTSIGPQWEESPSTLKPLADRAFCEGINRLVCHTLTATRPQDGLPGYEYGAGTHFNPNVTWWAQAAKPWLTYVNRCQTMLQSGRFVADVLYYNGDWAPNLVEPKHTDPSLGKGYDYDVCNAEVLLTRLSVKNHLLLLPDGMSYRLLVLPDSKRMPIEVARKIRDLVAAGATVVGPEPQSDPGLRHYPQCDAGVKKIAETVWGNCDGNTVKQRSFGKGRILCGLTLRDILQTDGIDPDFECLETNAFIDFIHRRDGDAEIYFLANRNNRPESVECVFRVGDKQPELWDPILGTRRSLSRFTMRNGRTGVPLEFEPNGSMFIVFRHRASAQAAGAEKNFPAFKKITEIVGPWQVNFDPQWFYPANGLNETAAKGLVVFGRLEDWSKRSEPAIRNFSGTAIYRKIFDMPRSIGNSRVFLDLGTVRETACVRLNGRDCGTLWCAPWRVEITDALKSGENQLEVEVVNLWPNRLIGDAGLPAGKRRTQTNIRTFKPDSPLKSSGLLGPVTLIQH